MKSSLQRTGSIFNRSKQEQSNAYKDISKRLKKKRSNSTKKKHDGVREDIIASNLPQNLKSCSHSLFTVHAFWIKNVVSLTDNELNELALSIYCHLHTSAQETVHHLLLKAKEMNVTSHILKIFNVFEYSLRQMTATDHNTNSHDKLVLLLKQLGDIHKNSLIDFECNIYELLLDAFNSCLEQKFNKIYSFENRFCFTQFYRLMVDIMNDNQYLSLHLMQTDSFLGSLSECLEHKNGSIYFKMFLQEQFQDENYLFCKAVQEYKLLETNHRIEIGNNIIDTHIKTSSDKQVNLRASTRKQILNVIHVTSKMSDINDQNSINAILLASKKSNLDVSDMINSVGFTTQLFDKAQQESITLMQRNSWNDFRNKILEYCAHEKFAKEQETKLLQRNKNTSQKRDLINRLKLIKKRRERVMTIDKSIDFSDERFAAELELETNDDDPINPIKMDLEIEALTTENSILCEDENTASRREIFYIGGIIFVGILLMYSYKSRKWMH